MPSRPKSLATVAIAALTLACLPIDALAQGSPYLEPGRRPDGTGVETNVVLGAGGLDDLSSNAFVSQPQSQVPDVQFGPGAGATVGMGYRYLPWLSSGVSLLYEYHPLQSSLQRATNAHGDTLVFGLYTRAYLGTLVGLRHIEPWIGVEFDPAATLWQAYALPNSTVALNVWSIAAAASLGFEVNITRSVAIGAMGEGSWWFPMQRCASLTGAALFVPATCNNQNLHSERGWFAGLSARFTIER